MKASQTKVRVGALEHVTEASDPIDPTSVASWLSKENDTTGSHSREVGPTTNGSATSWDEDDIGLSVDVDNARHKLAFRMRLSLYLLCLFHRTSLSIGTRHLSVNIIQVIP